MYYSKKNLVLFIIGINILLFTAQKIIPGFTENMILITGDIFPERIYTLFTYSLIHNDFFHLFFNMFALYLFGPPLFLYLNYRKFLTLYIGSGIVGGLFSFLFPHNYAILGASASVLGILTSYALYFPQTKVYLFFFIPLPLRHFLYLLMAVSLYYSVFGGGGNIAHLSHLGGIAFALIYHFKGWRIKRIYQNIRYEIKKRKFKVLK